MTTYDALAEMFLFRPETSAFIAWKMRFHWNGSGLWCHVHVNLMFACQTDFLPFDDAFHYFCRCWGCIFLCGKDTLRSKFQKEEHFISCNEHCCTRSTSNVNRSRLQICFIKLMESAWNWVIKLSQLHLLQLYSAWALVSRLARMKPSNGESDLIFDAWLRWRSSLDMEIFQ